MLPPAPAPIKEANVKEIIINDPKSRPPSAPRMREKMQTLFGHQALQNISDQQIQQNPQLVRRMLLKQMVNA